MVDIQGNVIEFRFIRPRAEEVFVVGDFNDWRADLPMVRDESGCWTARLSLAEGEYCFRYLADGQWFTDYAAFGVKAGDFGNDSVLWVPSCAEIEPSAV